jgi:sarcosine oxidase subunit alpha
MIGDETDGTVIPQDLDLGWAVSKKKADFIGKRAQERSDLTRRGRKRLVGLKTENPLDVLPDGVHAVKRVREEVAMTTIGHVTSTYFSPTLGHSIAMGLIEDGLSREGEWLNFSVAKGEVIRAQIVSPVFYDPEGAKQNV